MDKSVKDKLTKEAYELLKLPTIEFYYGPLEFFNENNIDENQEGFRYNANTGEIIEEWTGDEYVIIGFDYSAGCGPDPFIVKTDEKELPVFWLMTDGGDWANPTFISSSLKNFNKIINILSEYKDLFYHRSLSKEIADEIINRIEEVEGTDNLLEYWVDLVNSAVDEEE